MVWPMYNERSSRPCHGGELPLEAFAANRNAVVREVLRAKASTRDAYEKGGETEEKGRESSEIHLKSYRIS